MMIIEVDSLSWVVWFILLDKEVQLYSMQTDFYFDINLVTGQLDNEEHLCLVFLEKFHGVSHSGWINLDWWDNLFPLYSCQYLLSFILLTVAILISVGWYLIVVIPHICLMLVIMGIFFIVTCLWDSSVISYIYQVTWLLFIFNHAICFLAFEFLKILWILSSTLIFFFSIHSFCLLSMNYFLACAGDYILL